MASSDLIRRVFSVIQTAARGTLAGTLMKTEEAMYFEDRAV